MRRLVLFTALFLTIFCLSVNARIINIPADYSTIQGGINASLDGDTALISPGTYFENINYGGRNIVLASLFLTTRDTTYISSTIIDGNSLNATVAFENGEDNTAALIGISVTNGNSNAGGGIRCNFSSPSIIKNIIAQNSALGGGGIYCYNSYSIIADNRIANNEASGGGGIYCSSSDPMILNNIIMGNSVSGNGGGINCYSASPTIGNNIIQQNSAFIGGAVYCQSSSNAAIGSNLIVRNSASYGGAIYSYNSIPIIENNTVCGNSASLTGGAIFLSASNVLITNTIFWGDSAQYGAEIYAFNCTPTISYCDIQDGWVGEGNISVDPIFRGSSENDYRLAALECGWPQNSPSIDAGDPGKADILINCLRGLGSLRSDIGAYGGGDSTVIGINDQDPTLPKSCQLAQNYPNPFNAQTNIQYSLPTLSEVSIDIFDILGRNVAKIAEGMKPFGNHQAIWDASNQASGIYFYRIKAGDKVDTKKMVLMK